MKNNQNVRKFLVTASFILGGLAWLIGTQAEQIQLEDAVREEVKKQLSEVE